MPPSQQPVTWIEELDGRRRSLGLHAIIAVSASGFTGPAIIKAARFGIWLYDLAALSDDDIKSWVRRPTVKTKFLTFDFLYIVPVISNATFALLPSDPHLEKDGTDGTFEIMASLRKEIGRETYGKTGQAIIDARAFVFGGQPVKSLHCQYLFRETSHDAKCTLANFQGKPAETIAERGVAIANYDHSVPELIEFSGKVSVIFSTEKMQIPRNSIFYGVEVFIPGGEELVRQELQWTLTMIDLSGVKVFALPTDEDLSVDDVWRTIGRRMLNASGLGHMAAHFGVAR